MALPDLGSHRYGIIGINTDTHLGSTFHVDAGRQPSTKEGVLAIIAERVKDPRVIAAFERIDRADFVPDELKPHAYSNRGGLQLNEGLVLSQPSMVARMTEALRLDGGRVLEVGTGTGYGAAILAQLAEHVDSIEIDADSVAKTEWDLRYLGIGNVDVHAGDGRNGIPQRAPYDAILVTGAVDSVPQAWLDQLAEGGRLVYPSIEDPGYGQRLVRLTADQSGHSFEDLGSVNFGPLLPSAMQPRRGIVPAEIHT